MFRKIASLALLGALALTVASAQEKKGGPPSQEEMMAEMSKCMVCKNMLPHMEALMPVMKMESVKLNNGVAVVCNISDPKMLSTYHALCDKMTEAGNKAKALSAAEAKTSLCGFCQEIHAFTTAGGSMSLGKTSTGDLMVFSSDKAELKQHLMNLENICAMMSAPAAN